LPLYRYEEEETSYGKRAYTRSGGKAVIHATALSPDEKFLATACADGSVNIWDVNRSARTIYSGHSGPVMSVVWGLNGLESGSADNNIIVWQA
jgi:WD40 repeat protein